MVSHHATIPIRTVIKTKDNFLHYSLEFILFRFSLRAENFSAEKNLKLVIQKNKDDGKRTKRISFKKITKTINIK